MWIMYSFSLFCQCGNSILLIINNSNQSGLQGTTLPVINQTDTFTQTPVRD